MNRSGRVEQKGRCGVRQEVNVLALIKGEEHYVYIYDDGSRPDVLEAFKEQADDPQLSLTWFDAAVLGKRARQQAEEDVQVIPLSRLQF
jgi:hypothetical protein